MDERCIVEANQFVWLAEKIEDLASVPELAVRHSRGCGNPVSSADLRPERSGLGRIPEERPFTRHVHQMVNPKGSGANFIKCMFWSGEWSSRALCSQDRGPKLGSGGRFSG